MIFLTIGTHEPFVRLVRAVDEWYGSARTDQEMFGQVTDRGMQAYTPQHFKAIGRLAPQDYAAFLDRADLIISHAGMGSILTALSNAKPIVVMPRRGHLRETRNDHQYTALRHLEKYPEIYSAEDESVLAEVLDRATSEIGQRIHTQISSIAPASFTDTLRGYLLKLGDARNDPS